MRTRTASSHADRRRWRLRPLALSLACMGVGAAWAQVALPALPTGFPQGGTVMRGTVTVGSGGTANLVNLDQATLRAVVNWNAFSLSSGNTLNIQQQMGPASVLLNRVVGTGGVLERSAINGTLSANGRVYVINPAGVLFGPTARVNVGGLVASTLDVDDNAFMSGGRELTLSGPANVAPDPGTGLGIVEVQAGAKLSATGNGGRGGVIALVGASVVNRGEINVAQGSVGLLGGNQAVIVDPVGDGLTTFRIPVTNAADNASVANLVDAKAPEGARSGQITADGGHIALMAGSTFNGATVVNQQGLLQARSLESRNGEIVLSAVGSEGARNQMSVGGTLDASANGVAGVAGGRIAIEADVLRIAEANLKAGGGAGAANGKVSLTSTSDLHIQAPGSEPPGDGSSGVSAAVLGNTLGQGADLTLTSRAGRMGDFEGWGVIFEEGARIVKNEGGSATLAVNSDRNIEMRAGSAIQSKAGALAVDFNADASGSLEQDAIAFQGEAIPRRGAILMRDAAIETNGGDIRFYGQSDAARGRAVGDVVQEFPVDADPTTRRTAGIELERSTVSTCGVAQESCTGGGSISLRGEGSSWQYLDSGEKLDLDATSGVDIAGSTLRTGSGAISVQGRGGLGTLLDYGVEIGGSFSLDDTQNPWAYSRIASATGDISIAGSARGWKAGDAVGAGMDAGTGTLIWSSSLATGGNVSISGTGADISGVLGNAQFIALASSGGFHAEGTGVELSGASVTAGAGKSITVTGTAGSQAFIVNADGTVNQDFTPPSAVDLAGGSLVTPGGRISVQGGAGVVNIEAESSDSTPEDPGLLISAANAGGPGGSIDIRGRNVMVSGYNGEGFGYTRLDASGAGQAGSIDIHAVGADGVAASGILGIDNNVILAANATSPSGNGGSIRVLGDNTLRAYGTFEAKGGSAGGNGGAVDTSGGAFDLSGVRVDTSAPAGTAGSWIIDPYNVLIVSGDAAGSLSSNPFVPLAESTIQDGDINAALNAGANVTITTGTGGDPLAGDVEFDDAHISYTGAGERTFTVNAHRSVRANSSTVIASSGTGGPLNVVFNADVNGGGTATGGGQISYSGDIYTNGGNVTMNAAWANTSNLASVVLDGQTIDTRLGNAAVVNSDGTVIGYTGGSDALAGGNVSIVGRTNAPSAFNNVDGVVIDGTSIRTSTGDIGILGTTVNGSGVVIQAGQGEGGLFTTSGNIDVTGIGGFSPSGGFSPGYGVVVSAPDFNAAGQPRISSVDGDITVRGLRQAGAGTGAGVRVGGNAQITTSGQGDIEITGETQGNGAGVELAPTFTDTFGTQQGGVVAGNRVVVLRAANDGSTDALALGAGSQASAGVLMNLRPGGLDLQGTPDAYVATAVDRPANAVSLGGMAATGFAVSADEFTRIAAPNLVFGSNAHAGDITVVDALNTASALTLQNGGGGNIVLQAPVTTPRLGLVSAGNITQTAGAPITAGSLLALSSGGSVLLDQAPNNVSANTLGGGAAGAFRYQDVDDLRIGSVSVMGYDAAGNQPLPVSAASMAADTVFVRTLTGDLTLATNVSSTSGTDLAAAARFQNPGSGSLSGAPWRVWADTWVGESRGGVAGSGLTPNLYGCPYLGLCAVGITPGDNHFIYAQRPVATVFINSATRFFGQPNPLFGYTVAGLILGDNPLAFSGSIGTPATIFSLPGLYPIDGTFTSAAGYLVNVVPGTLRVAMLPDVPRPDVLRETPNTYTFDSNIGQPPICFATGPLGGDRAQQGDDLLAREWSRVRSRPNLTSCVDTERKNGCADF